VFAPRPLSGSPPFAAGLKILSAMLIASPPETLIIPIAPPQAVAMAQIVSLLVLFIQ